MFTFPWIADVQMNDPHPGTQLPGGYPPEYPPAAFPGKTLA